MILLIGSEKGGVGKSTIAVNMAAIRAKQGRAVLLIDTDKQNSALQWITLRASREIKPSITCVTVYGKSLPEQVRSLASRYDDVVIDAGGRDSIELRTALLVADLLITPSMPSQFDAFSLANMNGIVESARAFNSKLKATVLVNGAPTHPLETDTADMIEFVQGLDQYALLKTTVKDRRAYRLCARDGVAAPELNIQDKKATQEMLDLAQEVWE